MGGGVGVPARPVSAAEAFGPGQALQETLISLPHAALPEPGRGPSRCHLEATGRAVRQPESRK